MRSPPSWRTGLRVNRTFLAECERVAIDRDVGIDTRFMAMDRATRLMRANIAAARAPAAA
jgi:hypothetical protein